jgi:transmembrane sensor
VSTETGGSLWLQLPDGTKAGLTGATDVQLAKLDDKTLTLDVTRGSLAMVVPHREDRVLTVRAGDVEVKDLGTRFLVSREVARTVVAVEEGSVEVKTPRLSSVSFACWVRSQAARRMWRPVGMNRVCCCFSSALKCPSR